MRPLARRHPANRETKVEIANPSRCGLASSVWTAHVRRAMQVTLRPRYGMPSVATHGVGTPETPSTAMRGSGMGCDMTDYALGAYIAIRHANPTHG